jgi:hypothetical protein
VWQAVPHSLHGHSQQQQQHTQQVGKAVPRPLHGQSMGFLQHVHCAMSTQRVNPQRDTTLPKERACLVGLKWPPSRSIFQQQSCCAFELLLLLLMSTYWLWCGVVWCVVGVTVCRAKALAQQIGAYHLDINIDSLVGCVVALFTSITSKTPRFRVDGGTPAENLALQNIQVCYGCGCRCGCKSTHAYLG